MKMINKLAKQVHLVKDLILSDMICQTANDTDDAKKFPDQLSVMKNWFSRISWANKKRYILALLEDVRSAWTLSCLLKSLWNCAPKDAVISAHAQMPWSSYDRVPIDHNRTAHPVVTLAQVMKNGRFWFISLEPQAQAIVLLELLSISGGPIMWLVLKRSEALYEKYRTEQLNNLKECIVLSDSCQQNLDSPKKSKAHNTSEHKNHSTQKAESNLKPNSEPEQAQKELEDNLFIWNRTIKEMRESLKLEELEMAFKDGTQRKIWKVNRRKPEAIETVDYVQLLPSEVAKKILSFLSQSQLEDFAKVNKYWAFLVEEYRIEIGVQQKLADNLQKLEQLMFCHDISLEFIGPLSQTIKPASTCVASTQATSTKVLQTQPMSIRASEKSTGAYSFRHLVCDNLYKPVFAMKPLANLAELSERLERRGAADENITDWCNKILNYQKYRKVKRRAEGVIPPDNLKFPYPIVKETLDIPLPLPLIKDPAITSELKPKRNISNATIIAIPKRPKEKRYNLWTKDFSKLYPVYKIPSHASPI